MANQNRHKALRGPGIILVAIALVIAVIVCLLILTPKQPGLRADAQKPDSSVSVGSANSMHTLSSQAAHGLTSMPWQFVQLSPDRRTLFIQFVAGDASCVFPAGYTILDTPKGFELFVLSTTHPKPACGDSLVTAVGRISLPASLKGKALFHAPVSGGWDRGHYF